MHLGRANRLLWAFGLLKIPMIGFVRPRIVDLEDGVTVKIPLGRRTRNHLGSMYFGALSVGADLAAGWAALAAIERNRAAGGPRVDFVFKDVHGQFLRRPEGDVFFHCHAGADALVEQAVASGEREEQPVEVTATVEGHGEPVARFTLTLSVKARP